MSDDTDFLDSLRSVVAAHGEEHPEEPLALDDLIGRFPADLLASYTLVYQSGSLQAASPDHPRALLFGRDARVIVAFNGEASQANDQRLEVARINDKDQLELYAVDFPGEAPGGADVRFTGPNPSECAPCHGSGPHYIWGSYPNWKGVYGSDSDALLPGSAEAAAYAAFQAQAPSHPRYKYLQTQVTPDDPVMPYRPVHTTGFDQTTHLKNAEYRPNLRLGQMLGRRQSRAMAAQLREAKDYGRYRDLFAYVLTGCDQIPALARTKVPSVTAVADKLGAPLEEFLRVPAADHSLQYPEGYYYDGFASARSYLLAQVWSDVLAAHPALAPLYRPLPLGAMLGAYYSETPEGQAFWREADQLTVASSCLQGCEPDLRAFLKRTDVGLSTDELQTACKALGELMEPN